MDTTLLYNTLGLTLQLALPLLGGILVGAFIASILQTATQIEERVIAFSGKLSGLVVALYLTAATEHSQLLAFAERLWGGEDFFH